MPSRIKDFIKKQLKAEPESPGRFFTTYDGHFKLDGNDLAYSLSLLVDGIDDDIPSAQRMRKFLSQVKSKLQTICNEITREDPSIVIHERQFADLMTSLVFKMASYNFAESLKDTDTPLIEHQTKHVKSRIFINIAQEFCSNEDIELEEVIVNYYLGEFRKILSYFRSVLEQIDASEVLTQEDLVAKLNLNLNVNFRALPVVYQRTLMVDLCNLHLAAKNPYPITIESLEYVIRNKSGFAKAVEVTLLHSDPAQGHVDYAPGFEQGNRFHDIIETELVDRLVLFTKMYLTMLKQTPTLQCEEKLTPEGENRRESMLNTINALHPLPAKLVAFMKAFTAIHYQLECIHEQLLQGSPFAVGSEEHLALQCFYDKISAALSSLQSAEPVMLADGFLNTYTLSHFRSACKQAINEAEESVLVHALIHHPGWWANVFKPLLIAIGICVTVGLPLLSPTIRNYAYAGFFNLSRTTEGMNHVTAVQEALDETIDETYEDMRVNYGIYKK